MEQATGQANAVSWSALEGAARAGHLARAAVYAILGALVLDGAFGARTTAPRSGAYLSVLRDEPLGAALLVLLGIGLLGYAVWRGYAALSDAESWGSEVRGLLARAGMGVGAALYGSLALSAFAVASGAAATQLEPRSWIAGTPLLLAVGLGVLGSGVFELVGAFTHAPSRRWDLEAMSRVERRLGAYAAGAGLGARGLVFTLLGVLLLTDALGSGTAGSVRIGRALGALADASYGPWLLGAVGMGFLAYAAYSALDARYRRFATSR